MSHWITMVTAYGPMNGWSAEPDDRPLGGVVLVHEIFGVNADMRQIAERYAEDGYLTVVPALFDKLQREVELDYGAADYQLGGSLASQIGLETAAELVRAAAGAIAHAGKTAVIGYGWGGAVGLRAAQDLKSPVVNYYAPWELFWLTERSEMPALFHLGETDPRLSAANFTQLREMLPNMEKFVYPAGDAFDRISDPLQFHAQSAELAFERTRNFLRKHIRSADF